MDEWGLWTSPTGQALIGLLNALLNLITVVLVGYAAAAARMAVQHFMEMRRQQAELSRRESAKE